MVGGQPFPLFLLHGAREDMHLDTKSHPRFYGSSVTFEKYVKPWTQHKTTINHSTISLHKTWVTEFCLQLAGHCVKCSLLHGSARCLWHLRRDLGRQKNMEGIWGTWPLFLTVKPRVSDVGAQGDMQSSVTALFGLCDVVLKGMKALYGTLPRTSSPQSFVDFGRIDHPLVDFAYRCSVSKTAKHAARSRHSSASHSGFCGTLGARTELLLRVIVAVAAFMATVFMGCVALAVAMQVVELVAADAHNAYTMHIRFSQEYDRIICAYIYIYSYIMWYTVHIYIYIYIISLKLLSLGFVAIAFTCQNVCKDLRRLWKFSPCGVHCLTLILLWLESLLIYLLLEFQNGAIPMPASAFGSGSTTTSKASKSFSDCTVFWTNRKAKNAKYTQDLQRTVHSRFIFA